MHQACFIDGWTLVSPVEPWWGCVFSSWNFSDGVMIDAWRSGFRPRSFVIVHLVQENNGVHVSVTCRRRFVAVGRCKIFFGDNPASCDVGIQSRAESHSNDRLQFAESSLGELIALWEKLKACAWDDDRRSPRTWRTYCTLSASSVRNLWTPCYSYTGTFLSAACHLLASLVKSSSFRGASFI